MNKKTIYVVIICMLIGMCFISNVICAYPPENNKGKNELVKIHDNNYYDKNKIYAIAVFFTALQNDIDFDTSIMMGFNQLK